jgi:hypothetical protein
MVPAKSKAVGVPAHGCKEHVSIWAPDRAISLNFWEDPSDDTEIWDERNPVGGGRVVRERVAIVRRPTPSPGRVRWMWRLQFGMRRVWWRWLQRRRLRRLHDGGLQRQRQRPWPAKRSGAAKRSRDCSASGACGSESAESESTAASALGRRGECEPVGGGDGSDEHVHVSNSASRLVPTVGSFYLSRRRVRPRGGRFIEPALAFFCRLTKSAIEHSLPRLIHVARRSRTLGSDAELVIRDTQRLDHAPMTLARPLHGRLRLFSLDEQSLNSLNSASQQARP